MKDAFISFLLSLLVIVMFALYNATERNEIAESKINELTSDIENLNNEIDLLNSRLYFKDEIIENLSDYIALNIDNRRLDIAYFDVDFFINLNY